MNRMVKRGLRNFYKKKIARRKRAIVTIERRNQYSSHDLISSVSRSISQKAEIKAEASRELVMRGIFKSMAARRILYPLSSSPTVRFFGIFTTRSISFLCNRSRACGAPSSPGHATSVEDMPLLASIL